jgi:predicted P-loop ATPase
MDEAHDGNKVIPLTTRFSKPWHADCQKGKKGLLSNVANALIALRRDPDVRDVFMYDEMLRAIVMTHEIGRIDTCHRWVTEADVINAVEWLQLNGLPSIGIETVRNALHARAHECAQHPVRNYLRSLQWDGTPRLNFWLTTYLGAEYNAYNEHIGRMFLTSMVARIADPGCQADHMMVLEGPQGILKSSACRVLGGEWFSDGLPDITAGREASQHLRDKWLVEVAEMHSMNRAEATLLKSFISRTVERYRPSYGRLEVHEPRQCVFVGTTNMDQYLKDPTGGRRFWPVRTGVTGEIHLLLLEQNRDQLFAEAVQAYRNGAWWWPDASLENLIRPEQAARYQGDIWEDKIAEWLADHTEPTVTVRKIAENALSILSSQMRHEHALRIAAILRDLGWTSKRTGRQRWWESPSKKPSPTVTPSSANGDNVTAEN